jgi:hypothetical protein
LRGVCLPAVEWKSGCSLRVELFLIHGSGAAGGKAAYLLLLLLLGQVRPVSGRGRILRWDLLGKPVLDLGIFRGIITVS